MSFGRKPFNRRKKNCPFSGENAPKIDYKDVRLLQKYVSERGKIVPRRDKRRLSQKTKRVSKSYQTLTFSGSDALHCRVVQALIGGAYAI